MIPQRRRSPAPDPILFVLGGPGVSNIDGRTTGKGIRSWRSETSFCSKRAVRSMRTRARMPGHQARQGAGHAGKKGRPWCPGNDASCCGMLEGSDRFRHRSQRLRVFRSCLGASSRLPLVACSPSAIDGLCAVVTGFRPAHAVVDTVQRGNAVRESGADDGTDFAKRGLGSVDGRAATPAMCQL